MRGQGTNLKIIVIAKAKNQRFPNKHVADLAGRPLIHWALRDAVAVPGVPIVIATDSEDLNAVALEGIPPSDRDRALCLRRPPRLSRPRCSGWEAFFWAMEATEKELPGAALLVQGSVPVRPSWLLPEASRLMGCAAPPHVLYSAYREWQEGHGACYHIDGGVYGLANPETDERVVKNRALQAYLETQPGDCVDVDVPADLERVRAVLSSRGQA